MSDFSNEFKDGAFIFGLDSDNDGSMSISGKLMMNEAIAEAFSRGEEVPGNKVASVKFEGMSLKVIIDSDKDGEAVLELELNLPEAFDEGAKRI